MSFLLKKTKKPGQFYFKLIATIKTQTSKHLKL